MSSVRRSFGLGLMAGFCASMPVSLLAQQVDVSAWAQPPVVMSLVGVVLSLGGAWQMVADDRRRIAALEANSVARETFQETMKRIDGHLDQLTDWVHEQRRS